MKKKNEVTSEAPQAGGVHTKGHRRALRGVVVSDKMQKTIVVKVDRLVQHGRYNKYIARSKKYKAHDELNSAKTGDSVEITESRPMSREKKWSLKTILERATGVAREGEVQ
ncbi:MAG: 30S ribosomal protein S17 [Deltaproteobacteria bacterium]|nr:30S ribosomal protein S17 [Deltaproteobacteria bacterium]